MSYILDALNKSEKERTRKKTPGLGSLNDTDPPSPSNAKNFLLALIILAFVNAAGVYYFFNSNPENQRQRDLTNGNEIPDDALEVNSVATKRPVEQRPTSPPVLEVTAHIYATAPDLRMVKIDGIARHEGATIGQAHRLVEITEGGLVLEYLGKRYELNIVEAWQAP